MLTKRTFPDYDLLVSTERVNRPPSAKSKNMQAMLDEVQEEEHLHLFRRHQVNNLWERSNPHLYLATTVKLHVP